MWLRERWKESRKTIDQDIWNYFLHEVGSSAVGAGAGGFVGTVHRLVRGRREHQQLVPLMREKPRVHLHW